MHVSIHIFTLTYGSDNRVWKKIFSSAYVCSVIEYRRRPNKVSGYFYFLYKKISLGDASDTVAKLMNLCITCTRCLWHLFSFSLVFYFFYAEIMTMRKGDLILTLVSDMMVRGGPVGTRDEDAKL